MSSFATSTSTVFEPLGELLPLSRPSNATITTPTTKNAMPAATNTLDRRTSTPSWLRNCTTARAPHHGSCSAIDPSHRRVVAPVSTSFRIVDIPGHDLYGLLVSFPYDLM